MATEEKIQKITSEMDILINGQRDLRQLAHETQRQLQHHGEMIRHLQESADNHQRQLNNLTIGQEELKEKLTGVEEEQKSQRGLLEEILNRLPVKE
ncbi:hypothetical protein [Endozoicomonas ascidiicola]|uniref:hypothetical protein n=1 Tax=Endozoicomonas ascidiicola TaxID=1698521 RepID=UPI00082F9500|nr:hypothetical protein [Endozoicomonas ascidiicola]